MLTYPNIDPVALQLGPLKIHWYGLMYLAGFAAAWFLGKKRCARQDSPVNEEQLGDLIFYCALGVILGGRLGYVFFYNFDRFLSEPLWLFKVWEGGMSFHGGLIGVITAMLWYAAKLRKTFFEISDFIAPLVPFGLGAGRLGNFIGGELWGRVTDVPWAMVFPRDLQQLPRHPSQLYQFALEGVAFFLILWWFSSKPRPRMAVSGLFLICYGIFRILVEFVREPDVQLGYLAWGWLTMGQLLSLPMVLAGLGMMVWAFRHQQAQYASNKG
ncbi:MAG: prolipoprotein diacylglyceryl transferase [Hahellaceae bacterium]|nr:prolipoprotein diacylglyceryl transferase [Hahellaceae bacterium]MCP5169879.1 prolipoprotein diacylglyceryl transferase [Hahellaceae bacterium]